MIEDDFYSTIKLKSGEEIFCKVAASEEEGRTMLIMTYPVVIQQIKSRIGNVGYKIEPWLKTTSEDTFIINMNDVLTMTESSDIEMIMMYQDYMRSNDKDNNRNSNNHSKINRRMGYLSSVNDAKEVLEKIYKNTNKNSKNS